MSDSEGRFRERSLSAIKVSANTPVGEFIEPLVHSISVHENLSRAKDLMVEHHLHHVPVVDEGRLVGMISAVDLIAVGFSLDKDESSQWQKSLDRQYRTSEVMKREPNSIGIEQALARAVEMLCTGDFHALPVVQADRLVGILTSTDLLRIMHRLLLQPEEGRTASVRSQEQGAV